MIRPNSVEELNLAISGGCRRPPREWAMLSAFFDESGTHDDSAAIAIAGYSATPEEWTAFEGRWLAALNVYGLEDFHMSAFEARISPFDQLDDTDRHSLLMSLVGCIVDHDLIGTAAVVKRLDFKMAEISGASSQVNDPYLTLAMKVMTPFAFFARSIDERVYFTFDRRQKITGIVTELLDAFKVEYPILTPSLFDTFSIGSTVEYKPLQAADLLAWEVYTRGCDFSAPKRQSFEALERNHLKLFVVGPGELALYGPNATLRKIAREVW